MYNAAAVPNVKPSINLDVLVLVQTENTFPPKSMI